MDDLQKSRKIITALGQEFPTSVGCGKYRIPLQYPKVSMAETLDAFLRQNPECVWTFIWNDPSGEGYRTSVSFISHISFMHLSDAVMFKLML